MFRLLKKQMYREFLVSLRQIHLILNSSLFFLLIVVLFPLSMLPDKQFLQTIAPGLIWLAMLLAFLLSAERLFQQDFHNGIIEQWLCSDAPLYLLVLSKILIQWLLNVLPFIFFCPLLAILFGLSCSDIVILVTSIILGTPPLVFFCGLAAIFTIGLNQKGALMALILLPLTIPVMIFGSDTLTAYMQGFPISGHLALLLAFSLLCCLLMPFAIAAIVRIQV